MELWVPEFPHLCGVLGSRVPTPVWESRFQSSHTCAGFWVPEFPHPCGDLGSRVPTPVRGSGFQSSHTCAGFWVPEFPHLCGDLGSRVPKTVIFIQCVFDQTCTLSPCAIIIMHSMYQIVYQRRYYNWIRLHAWLQYAAMLFNLHHSCCTYVRITENGITNSSLTDQHCVWSYFTAFGRNDRIVFGRF